LRYGIFDAASRAAAIFIGLWWGTVGIAAALSATALFVHLPAQIWYACRVGPVRQADVYGMLTPIVIGSLAGLVAVLLVQHTFPTSNPFAAIALSGAVLATVEVLALLATPSGRLLLRDMRRGIEILLRHRVPRG
jgi:hypothetical protein